MLRLVRRVPPCVRYAKNTGRLRTFLSRMHSDKADGRVATVADVGATPPFGTQRQAKVHQEQLLELIKLTADIQDRVKKLDEAVSEGKEALPSHVELILVGLQKAIEGVEIASERDENQRIASAFLEAGICFNTTDDINYLLWREFNSTNTNIHIDRMGVIQEEATRFVFPVIKELIIRPPEEDKPVTLYISNHFILLLEEKEAGETTRTEKTFVLATQKLYSSDGELQPVTTILNRNAWFIKDIQRGLENFFLRSVAQDVCIQAGTDTPLKAITSGMCTRNLESANIGRLD